MSLVASIQDFEPADPIEGAAALYYHPGDPDGLIGYRQYPYFQQRIDSLVNLVPPTNQKIAIWGCAWGYLVNLAIAAGYDAYGFDASSYAISRGAELMPNIASKLFVRSALVATDTVGAKRDAGMKGAAKFAMLVTEDMFTCMSDAEVKTALGLLRQISTGNANDYHIVTQLEMAGTDNDPRINWKLADDWKSLLAPDTVIGTHGVIQ